MGKISLNFNHSDLDKITEKTTKIDSLVSSLKKEINELSYLNISIDLKQE